MHLIEKILAAVKHRPDHDVVHRIERAQHDINESLAEIKREQYVLRRLVDNMQRRRDNDDVH